MPLRSIARALLFAMVPVVGATAAPARAGLLDLEYEAALRLYARGEHEAAVAALSRLRPALLDEQIHLLQSAARQAARCPSCRDPLKELPLKAAVLLHVDRDEADRPLAVATEQPRACPGDNARRAAQIAALLAQRAPEDDFPRRFFLGMAQRCQWDFCLDAAVQWGRDGLARFPHDPSLLLTLGATLEEQATLASFPGPAPSARKTIEATRAREHRFLDAQAVLAEAVAAAPASVEARVRLGRVQFKLHQDEAARATLEEALRRGGPSPQPFLAHLFLGQVHERAGRMADALRELAQARDLAPESQSAAIALSQARLATGDVEGARMALEQGLAYAGQRSARDAHWDYLASDAAGAPDLFEVMRAETRE